MNAEPTGKQLEPNAFPFRDTLIKYRLALLVLGHLFIFSFVYFCAFGMRFTFDIPDKYISLMFAGMPLVVAAKLVVFYALRTFHGWWRHVTFSDFIALCRTSFIATLAIVAFDYFFMNGQIPRTVILNDFVLTIVVIGSLRSVCRVWDERISPLKGGKNRKRALLVGASIKSSNLAHLINSQHLLGTRVVGLISGNNKNIGARFSDLRVVGDVADLPALVKSFRADTVFMTPGSVPAKELRSVLDSASDSNFKVKIIPDLADQLRGDERLPVREVSCNDLLRRKEVKLDLGLIESSFEGKTILVTGAGGSIGSELCRQLVRFRPEAIVLLGRGENRIYHIEKELRQLAPDVQLIPRIATVTDERRMIEIFDKLRPQVVFHAAAHKHVPLVEQNVGESIVNNVLGTKVVADLSDRFCVERFVLISTDKSVNPTSMMGCTKQMAERYCLALGNQSPTSFICTRFGNVLGSQGSVVPLFQEQIRNGGPITVTDERMTRFFMTIPEASQLVLQAGSMGSGGEIFVLEMGEPVKIVDLARDLIRLAGHQPGSIDIVFKGIRQGEKLYEELYYGDEQSIPTKHEQILSAYCRPFVLDEVEKEVHQLLSVAFEEPVVIREVMQRLVPEYQPEQKTVVDQNDDSQTEVFQEK
jgi:FlaA1/EpsC-like NDP-sugar epimerase